MQAIKLICVNEGWQWTLGTFLTQHVRKALDECTQMTTASATNENSLSTFKANQLLAFYLMLQGEIISHMCPKKSTTSQALDAIKSFGMLLKNSSSKKESLIVEYALIRSLTLLSPFNPTECLTQIQIWLTLYKNTYKNETLKLPKNLELNIQYIFNFFKDKLPSNLIVSF